MPLDAWQRDILDSGDLYRVGGSVRDRLLNPDAIPADTDFLVRGVPPESLERILERHGDLALVGRFFGVYRFTPRPAGTAVDIAYPRREQSTGPGHRDFEVQSDWTLAVEDDLARRDFTINAIAEHVGTGRRIDPHGGEADIRARIIRMMFPEAFVEDPLRVLRGLRFAAQLGFTIEDATRERMRESAGLLSTLSAERTQEELTKTLTRCGRPSRFFEDAHDIGALAAILPELDRCAGVEQNEYHPDDVFVHSIKSCDCAPQDNLAVRWAALLHDVGKVDARRTIDDERGSRVVFYGHENLSARDTVAALTRLRYSGALVERCRALVQHHMFDYSPEWKDATVRRFMRTVGERYLDDLFALRVADSMSRSLTAEVDNVNELEARVRAEQDARHTIDVAALAIDGNDVMKLCGVAAGPRVGAILERVLEAVIDDPSLNERAQLLDVVLKWAKEGKV